jgi:hypothetical protein
MRYRDRANPTARVDFRDCSLVQKRDAIPEQISGRRLHKQSALADSKFGLGADAQKVRRFFFETVSMIGSETGKCGPFLATVADKLPFIPANGAICRWLNRLGKLGSALHADEILHFRIL